jgi:beta-N-acetylhexosaminidase
LDQLLDRDLIPYRILIREGIPAIMTGHLAFPRILGNLTPSSLSPFFIQSVLRDRLGFKGIVITDDMEMEGVLADGLDTAEACRKAIEAGNDMVLVSHTPRVQEETWAALSAAMRSSAAFRDVVKGSVRRILVTKLRAFAPGNPAVMPVPASVASLIPAAGARDFFSQVSARAVTLLAGKRVPYSPGRTEKILLAGQYTEFLEEGKRRYPRADTWYFPFNPFYTARPEDKAAISARAGSYDTIIICVANYNSLEILKMLKAVASRVIVISALSPVYLDEVPWVQTALAVYGDSRDSFRAGLSALAGDYPASGVLPVRFGPVQAAQ